ncbi:sigma-E factor negative regulatory protein [Paenalcaligenes niemegkensis]|uniref:sigma-E factor negative regulatory protein n=1 Tax=Paenalcaligenes niemegkensis TaxID=2895469 RepID=UPI001EE78765|nr:RseA family anti-sigma factor [Paenalcaligenes niemegkensis]MCQ9616883.1 sigma-E factor negative regulatory protein [Paenalcaligenes niemegkensis]
MSSSKTSINSHDDFSSWEESVSAWVDGDRKIRPDELNTPYGRQVWDTYHLIGDVLRSEELSITPSDKFYARLSKAIDDEPTVLAPRYLPRQKPVRWGMSGLAVAAAVAAVAWVALPYFSSGSQLPASTPVLASVSDDAWLDYVDAHRDMSGVGPARQVSYELGVANQ